MYRFLFRPKWIGFHLLCIFGVVLMVNLSLWQFHRLDARKTFNSEVKERSSLSIVDVSTLDTSDPLSVEWRPAGVTGTYLADEQVLILNRSQGGIAGMNVLTPLLLADGRAIMINRGFIALSATPPSAPTGPVEVVGTLRASEERTTGQATEASGELTEFFRLDINRLQQQIDPELIPVALVAERSRPADSSVLTPVDPPELSEGPHLSYAIQWLIFSTAVIVGWVLAVRKSIANRALTAPSA
ncbi:MAG: SURF1 family protein [Actinomycetes bacterium]